MKRVLLIGDSIRMSYNERVAQLLENRAFVWGPEDNCRFAKYTLWGINGWMNMDGKGSPDIIHWNNGIWDAHKISSRIEVFVPLDEYLKTLEQVYNEMKSRCATVIFTTTTPVGEGFPSCSNDTIDLYNREAIRLLAGLGAGIHDLHAEIAPDTGRYLGDDRLHLSPEGVEKAAAAVARFVARYL
ncbi:MAG TPA: SGNH/GDSL hydrolase family protein [Clostridiales bacterium]|nr:MAG: hypothetical protein BWY37_00573 [Firmicutes bacterium ADurb.Bin262]HOU10846.1 SGNH/GDSL hydrolase family protein [Clostridiales bacterium]HQH63850.1 SGNH/GDSL hydrolase family protein [Clostridiales bacterium]HQK72926.1 SGNH/GDSL hydrolase family protein [Clostridiales bacterium]